MQIIFLYMISSLLVISNVNAEAPPKCKKGTIKLESIIQAAPWEINAEPASLPKKWKKHQAKQNIIVSYAGVNIFIPRGNKYIYL